MKILFINGLFNYGSTGTIVKSLFDFSKKSGEDVYAIYGYFFSPETNVFKTIKIKNKYPLYLEMLKTRLTGYNGFNRKRETKRAIELIETIKPDVINIHNLHGGYINSLELMKYIATKNYKVVLTLHDCWNMTGQCPHFIEYGCEKWKKKCKNCKFFRKIEYPRSWLFDRSEKQFNYKMMMFAKNDNIVVVSPCKWMSSLVSKSTILSKKRKFVIYNGVDFWKTDSQPIDLPSSRKILLGVSASWTKSKGIDDFGSLSKLISSDYQIVLVGKARRSVIKKYPNIIFLGNKLGKGKIKYVYEKSFLFLNMTHADTFPTTNIEALQSGTPIISYNTGGCPELKKEGAVSIVYNNSVDSMLEAIKKSETITFSREQIKEYGMSFSKQKMNEKYLDLFRNFLKEDNKGEGI